LFSTIHPSYFPEIKSLEFSSLSREPIDPHMEMSYHQIGAAEIPGVLVFQ